MKQYQSKDRFVVTYSYSDYNGRLIINTSNIKPDIPDGSYSDGCITLLLMESIYKQTGTFCSIINWWLCNDEQ